MRTTEEKLRSSRSAWRITASWRGRGKTTDVGVDSSVGFFRQAERAGAGGCGLAVCFGIADYWLIGLTMIEYYTRRNEKTHCGIFFFKIP
jgi:hypothetical protein